MSMSSMSGRLQDRNNKDQAADFTRCVSMKKIIRRIKMKKKKNKSPHNHSG